MTVRISEVGYPLVPFLPAAVLLFSFHLRHKKEMPQSKAPFDELQRRPAGESNRLRVKELNDKIDPWLMTIIVTPILFALSLVLQKQSWMAALLAFFIVTIFCLIAERRLRPLLRQRAAYRLGFQGERYVAEELNQLMTEGFHVFHDVPFEKYNIDHVLVGPTGVFSVETKAKRKRLAHREEKHKVLFDGARLNFPDGKWDTKALDQARLNAKTLSQWLSSATADQITAHPILTIPGWFVERSARSDVYVTNPKQIRSFVLNSTENPLTAAEIQRAVHQLEEKCKLAIE